MDDYPKLLELMNMAIAQLMNDFLSPAEVEASYEVMGVDSTLINDGSYYVVEQNKMIIGCGGWSYRETLFGGDHTDGRNARMLDPAAEPARVRAMYTHPEYTRKGIGKMVIGHCEQAAALAGFKKCVLVATMAGAPLYRVCGYAINRKFFQKTKSGVSVPLLNMVKAL